MILKTPLFLALLVLSSVAFSSPGASSHIREIPLAFSDTAYYSYVIKRSRPGSYYRFTDSVFLVKRNFQGIQRQKTALRIVQHRDTSTLGDWQQTSRILNLMNMEAYLQEEKAQFLFPMPSTDAITNQFNFDSSGIVMHRTVQDDNNNRTQVTAPVMDLTNLLGYLPWIGPEVEPRGPYKPRINQVFLAGKYVLLLVEMGPGDDDVELYQGIVAMTEASLEHAYERIQGKIDRRN